MQLEQFEQEILRLAFETESRITTASVAYYLGIPSRDANQMLNELLKEGVLELESDLDGNLYYSIPNQSDEIKAIIELKKSSGQAVTSQVTSHVFGAHASVSPRTKSPVVAAASIEGDVVSPLKMVRLPPVPAPTAAAPQKDNWGGFEAYYAQPDASTSPRGVVGHGQPAQTPLAWTGAVSRGASTDGSIGHQSLGSSVLVSARARCEPRLLADNRPIIAACAEPVAGLPEIVNTYSEYDDGWFGRQESAMVLADETAIARDYNLEKPEHQPGMALLLSLILCGTGQIYNGEASKGIMMMVVCFLLWFVLLGWVVHIWSIVDAVVVAEKLNRTGEVPN